MKHFFYQTRLFSFLLAQICRVIARVVDVLVVELMRVPSVLKLVASALEPFVLIAAVHVPFAGKLFFVRISTFFRGDKTLKKFKFIDKGGSKQIVNLSF